MEKQIEEMQNALIKIAKQSIMVDGLEDWSGVIAEKLYQVGYRKDSDIAEEIFEEIEKILYKFKYPSLTSIATGQIQTITTDGHHIDTEAFAKLKKKYTERKKDNDTH